MAGFGRKEQFCYNTDMNEIKDIDTSVFIADGAQIHGNIRIGENSSVWFNAVIRCEDTTVVIGDHTNIQDNCVIHTDPWTKVVIGNYVSVGHSAVVHGCTIGDNTLIGMGAVIMNDAVIGRNCIVGAGALVTEKMIIPDGSVVIGAPAVIKRTIREEEILKNRQNALHYVEIAGRYAHTEERSS